MQAQMMNFTARRGRLHYLRGPSGGQVARSEAASLKQKFSGGSKARTEGGEFRKADLREYVGGPVNVE